MNLDDMLLSLPTDLEMLLLLVYALNGALRGVLMERLARVHFVAAALQRGRLPL